MEARTEDYDTGLHGYLVTRDGSDAISCFVNQATLDRIKGIQGTLSIYEKMLVQVIRDETTVPSIFPPVGLEKMGTILWDDDTPPEHTDGMKYEKICVVIAKVRKKGESDG